MHTSKSKAITKIQQRIITGKVTKEIKWNNKKLSKPKGRQKKGRKNRREKEKTSKMIYLKPVMSKVH